ncbi:MAG: carbohydrate porin, partial [Gammaproteobacteria bacterium]
GMPWKNYATATALATMIMPALAQSPINGEFAYVSDYLRNNSGGIRTGSAYLQNVDVTFEFDVEQLVGLSNGNLFAYFLWNDDTTFSDRYPGDGQVISNIDTTEALRLYEFWYEHSFSESVNLRVGLYDLNSEFDAIDTAGLFLNSSHGIGPDYSQTGENGPSIFPSTSFAARLHWDLSENSLVRYGIFDGVPGDPNDASATAVQFNGGDGFLQALEFNHTLSNGIRLGVGGFSYSEDFETINRTDAMGNPLRDDGNSGVYTFADGTVYEDADGHSMTAFVRYGIANEKLNPLQGYFGLGAAFTGLVPGRPNDQLGLAIASARSGDDFRAATGAESHETTIELTYSAQITDWLRIQPDFQYIINPAADPMLKNAFVIGVRFEVASGFGFN